MTRIIVIAKSSHTVLHNSQTAKVNLIQPSYVKVAMHKEDIASLTRAENNCIITLKNGQVIVIENFFIDDIGENNILLFNGTLSEYEQAEFDIHGEFIDYTPVNEKLQNVRSETVAPDSNTQMQTATANPTTPPEEDDSPSLLKAGLAVLAAEAAYLVAFKDDGDSKDKNIDRIPPIKPTAKLDEDGKVITGQAEAGSTVYVKDANGEILGQAQADSDGNYEITLDRPVTDGEKVNVFAKNPAGKESDGKEVTGNKDTIAPDAANAQVNDDGSMVFGYAEAGTKVYLYTADGELGPVTVAPDGSFSLSVKPALKPGETAKVVVEDEAGNRSEESSVEIGQDTLAPDQPKFEVKEDGSSLKGQAEANSTIEIKDSNGNLIGRGQANDQGDFEIILNPALAEGETASITVKDAAGNTSKPMDITAGQDNIAPDAPSVTLNEQGTEITGQAEPGSRIEIRKGNSLLGFGTVDDDGNYTIKLSPALTDGELAKVYAIDAAGNQSDPIDIRGSKDTEAPSAPFLSKVYDDTGESEVSIKSGGSTQDGTPVFEGTGEKYATITIYQNGVAIATVEVGADRKWNYTPELDLDPGKYSYSFSQTDLAGNISDKSAAFEFTVEAADPETLLADTTGVNEELTSAASQLVALELLLNDSAQTEINAVEEQEFDIHSLLSRDDEISFNQTEIDLESLNLDKVVMDDSAAERALAEKSTEPMAVLQSVQMADLTHVRMDLDELQHPSWAFV
ncbi:Ig-like domain-containing protein [Acinetobacter bohemicus]|uniref:Ig-like domain-containing protein n=1 Tax=Acinetobacter sp. S4397-1 TaxID=2972915 RepID=UPI00209A9809|nr:Ig-like domain-containing protein [Acinetobacter sp. S4397-1]MCO8044034.1 Ig-like domain-containing protein [Acinetobacter sp. S4397-1]